MITLSSRNSFIVENTDTKKLEKIFLVVKDEELLIDNVSQNLALIDNEQYKWSEMTVKTEHFIGYLDSNSLYALELEDESSLMAETSLKPFRTLLGIIPDIYFGICSRSIQLVEWNKNSKYCGVCGSETSMHSIEKAMFCKKCNNLIYSNQLSFQNKLKQEHFQEFQLNKPHPKMYDLNQILVVLKGQTKKQNMFGQN